MGTTSAKMILITGGSGFVGRNLLRRLACEGMRIKCLVRDKSNIFWNDSIEIIKGDITDRNILCEATKGVDTIIHLAAVIKSSVTDKFIGVNIIGTKNLIDAGLMNGVKRIIYISSLDATLDNPNIYGRTKAGGEAEIIKSNIDYIILRPALIYGKDSKDINILAKIIKIFPAIPVIGDGTCKLQPVYVNDVCEIIVKLIKSDIKNKIYYIAGEQEINMNDLIDKIARVYAKKVFKVHVPLWLLWVPIKIYNFFLKNSTLNYQALKLLNRDKTCKINEIKKEFNFKPVNIDDGLRHILQGS